MELPFFIIYMLWNARCMQHGPHKSGSSTKLLSYWFHLIF